MKEKQQVHLAVENISQGLRWETKGITWWHARFRDREVENFWGVRLFMTTSNYFCESPKKFSKQLRIPLVSCFQWINCSLADASDTINSMESFTMFFNYYLNKQPPLATVYLFRIVIYYDVIMVHWYWPKAKRFFDVYRQSVWMSPKNPFVNNVDFAIGIG